LQVDEDEALTGEVSKTLIETEPYEFLGDIQGANSKPLPLPP
jgi:hypothetical protein